jgi:leucyl-tRNA synthetase
MRDWLISRQRYWGAPIPIIHCPKDGVVPVPDKDLPVLLPDISDFQPRGDGQSPLANSSAFVNTVCPMCGGPAKRETDTMDGFACSSWYFLRFADPHNDHEPFTKTKVDYWLPVDDYIGGAEHAVMHLLYARFWTKVIFDEGLINFQEPFTKLHNHGMILAPDGSKMSKSKNNTIEPDSLINQGYGADSIRLMELFIGPWNQVAAWSTEGLGGTYHFLQRIWTLCQEFLLATKPDHDLNDTDEAFNKELQRLMHRTIKLVTEDMQEFGFNTAIASLMELVNGLYKMKVTDEFRHYQQWRTAVEQLLKLLAPFAPFISEELWHDLGHFDSIHQTTWPEWDESLLSETTTTIVVQINGKLRAEIKMPLPTNQEAITKTAMTHEKVIPYLSGKNIVKTIYVPEKIINFVLNN